MNSLLALIALFAIIVSTQAACYESCMDRCSGSWFDCSPKCQYLCRNDDDDLLHVRDSYDNALPAQSCRKQCANLYGTRTPLFGSCVSRCEARASQDDDEDTYGCYEKCMDKCTGSWSDCSPKCSYVCRNDDDDLVRDSKHHASAAQSCRKQCTFWHRTTSPLFGKCVSTCKAYASKDDDLLHVRDSYDNALPAQSCRKQCTNLYGTRTPLFGSCVSRCEARASQDDDEDTYGCYEKCMDKCTGSWSDCSPKCSYVCRN